MLTGGNKWILSWDLGVYDIHSVEIKDALKQ